MTIYQQTVWMFGGVFAILVIASSIAWLLARRASARNAGGPGSVIANLNARINAWWVMVGLIGFAFLFGDIGIVVLFALVSFFALREFITLTPTRRGDHLALLMAFFVVLPAQYFLVATEQYGLFAIFIPVYAFLLLPVLQALSSDTMRFLERSAKVQWGLMIAVYCISYVPALLMLDIPGYTGRNALLLCFFVFVVQISDVLQYVWGKVLGRTRIAPELSPSKTVEGFVGGVLSASALGAALWWITPFSPLVAGGMALVITLMGFFGGLVMSAIKRDRGVKDWGHMIEGHGGMLDRLDSVCFAAPIFFHVTRYFYTN
jgi:phosphatidate cytidylyltransferase